MPSVKLLSFEETYSLSDQTARSTVKFDVSDRYKITAFTTQPDGLSGVEVEAKKWSIGHHHPTRSSFFKYKASVGDNTKLTLSQAVPNNKWFLVPTPAFKIAHRNAIGDDSLIELGWDMLNRRGQACVTMYGGDDRDYKAHLELHSQGAIQGKLRAKLHKGVVHSLTAGFYSTHLPRLSVKSRFGDDLKTKTTYYVGENVLKIDAKRQGKETEEGGVRMTTMLEAIVPLASKGRESKVIVGVKAHF